MLLASAVVVIVVALVWIGRAQRDATTETVLQQRAGHALSDAAFDMETGIEGFVLTAQMSFLTIAQDGRDAFTAGLADARRVTTHAPGADGALDAQADAIDEWWVVADGQTAAVSAAGRADDAAEYAQARAEVMDRFRAANRAYQEALGRAGVGSVDEATRVAIVAIMGTGLVFLLLGYVLVLRADRRASRRAALDAQFTERMLFVRSEDEACTLLREHLGEVLPGTSSEVLVSPSDARAVHCEALRTGEAVWRGGRAGGAEPGPPCTACAETGRRSLCTPLRTGATAIGAVVVGARRTGDIDERSIRQALGQAAPVLANLRNLAVAEERASTDALTGLPNRREVEHALDRMAADAVRTVRPLAAVMLDVDRFKEINDRWGHVRGDAVLVEVAAVLRTSVRPKDFVGRAGGEEFVLLLPSTDREEAAHVAEAVRAAVAREPFEGLDGGVTASLGIAVFPDDCDDVTRLLALADRAMYYAKERGRNRVARVMVAAHR